MKHLNSIKHRLEVLTLATVLITSSANAGTIIGHNDVAGVAALPQATMDAIGRQRWLFTHASVGGNIIEGLADLHTASPGRYRLVTDTAGDGSSVYSPPATTVPGTIYDANRGNPGWSEKFAIFDSAVRTSGWHAPKVDMIMNKLCFIDQDANPTNYIASMTALERDYPGTVLVYTTMPLMDNEDADNCLRNDYNNVVRAHCQTNQGVLLDIADIESHDPAGNPITFTNQGKVYQKLNSNYSSDGGHLNTAGEQRVALGWYAAAATLTPRLTIARTAGTTLISWPAPAGDCTFEHTSELSATAATPWTTAALPCQTNHGTISVTITNQSASGNHFFRLHKP